VAELSVFSIYTQIDRLAKAGLLYVVAEKFAGIDLHLDTVPNSSCRLFTLLTSISDTFQTPRGMSCLYLIDSAMSNME
jgi:hypothetical protein